VFVFPFGAAGLHGYGEASRWISIFSSCALFPAVAIFCWPRKTEHGTSRQLKQSTEDSRSMAA
jgi:hypothetical protein